MPFELVEDEETKTNALEPVPDTPSPSGRFQPLETQPAANTEKYQLRSSRFDEVADDAPSPVVETAPSPSGSTVETGDGLPKQPKPRTQFAPVSEENDKAFEAPVYNGGDPELDNEISDSKARAEKLAGVLFTPDELEELKNKGPIKWYEYKKFLDFGDIMPVSQGIGNAKDAINLSIIAKKMQAGEEVSEKQQAFMTEYMKRQTEMSLRGFKWGGAVAYHGLQMSAFMIEFGGSMALGQGITKVAAQKAATTGAVKLAEKAILKKAATVATTVAATTIAAPQLYVPNYGERRVSEYVSVTDKGEMLLSEAEEKPFTTALKAFGHAGTEVASELSGPAINKFAVKPLKKVTKPLFVAGFNKLPVKVKDGLVRAYQKINPNAKVTEIFSRIGWHGVLEELGEERVGDVLRTALDLDGEEGYSFEQIGEALYPGMDQIAVEAGVIAMVGGARKVGDVIVNKMEAKGYSKEEAKETVKGMSQLEQEAVFDDMTKDEVTASLDKVEKAALEQATKSGVDKDQARAYSKIMRGRALMHAQNYGVKPEEYYNNLNLQINNLQAAEQKYFDRLRTRARKTREKQEFDAAQETTVDLTGQKVKKKLRETPTPKPLLKALVGRGRVKRGSDAEKRLKEVGITPKAYPRLFAKDGTVTGLDNIVADELENELGVSGIFSRNEDNNGYVDVNELVEAIRDESFGKYIRNDGERETEALLEADNEVLTELDKRGIDIESASNKEIRDAIKAAQQEVSMLQREAEDNMLSDEDAQALEDMFLFQDSVNQSKNGSVNSDKLQIDVEFADEVATGKDLSTPEALALHNTIVELKQTLWDEGFLPYSVLDELNDVQTIDDLGSYTVTEEFLKQIGENRDITEIYEDKLEDAQNGMMDAEEFMSSDDVFAWAKAAKGTTESMEEAGYILPDGTMLDFSGKRDGGPSGVRYEDHRQLDIPEMGGITGTDLMEAFIELGAIRTDGANGVMTIAVKPTSQQLRLIEEMIDRVGSDSFISLEDGSRNTTIQPSDGKSASNNIRKFFSGNDVGGQVFYQSNQADFGLRSVLMDAATELKQEKGTGDQYLAMLRKTAGVKEAEIAWTGLDEFLKGKASVTKQEIVDYLDENQVQIEEVTLAEDYGDVEVWWEDEGGANEETPFQELPETEQREALERYRDEVGDTVESNTKYSEYTLAGGENYREVLLTLPSKKPKELLEYKDWFKQYGDKKKTAAILRQEYEAWYASQRKNTPLPEEYDSSHFDQKNILAHVRLNDRTTADGKRVLFVEEIQSDWHQAGRKKGYKTSRQEKEYKRLQSRSDQIDDRLNMVRSYLWDMRDESDEKRQKLNNERKALEKENKEIIKKLNDLMPNGSVGLVPDAPFKKNWHEMAFRRVAQIAALNNYDMIAWTPGQVQSERFDLSKQLSKIRAEKLDGGYKSGQYTISGYDKDGKNVINNAYPESELENVVGKDLAKKIVEEAKDYPDGKDYEGLDLQVGGDGMKGFYDKILKNYADKFGKKYKSKVGVTNIETDEEAGKDVYHVVLTNGKVVHTTESKKNADATAKSFEGSVVKLAENNSTDVWSLPVTSEMRESAKKGYELFQDKRGAINFTEQGKKIITLFEDADKSTLFHELGHMFLTELEQTAQVSDAAAKQLQTINKWLGADGTGYSREQHELFARGFERYLYEGSAPSRSLGKAFEAVKEWMGELYRSVSSLNAPINNEVRDAFDFILGGKDLDLYDTEIQIDDTETAFGGFYRMWVDSLNPVEKATKMFMDMGGKVPEGLNANFLARMYASVKSRIKHNIQTATFYMDENGAFVQTGEGLKSVLDDFDKEFEGIEKDYKQRLADLQDYLVSRRYQQDLMKRDDVNVSARQAENASKIFIELQNKYGDKFARLDHYAERIYGFQRRVLYNLVRSGVMSEDAYKDILKNNKNYVPFQRVLDDLGVPESTMMVTGKSRLDGKGAKNAVKKIEGSDREVKDIYNSMLQNTARIIQAAERNQIAKSIAGMQDFMPENIQPASVKLRKIKQDDGTEKMVPDGAPYGNVLEYFEDGKRKYIKVSQPMYEAITDMHPAQLGWISRFFSGVANVFRAGATLVPDFWIRNFGRDILAANIQSKEGITPIDIAAGMAAAMGKTKLYKEWERSGGPFDSYMDMSDKGVQVAFEELLRPRGKAMRYAKTLGLEALRDASGVFEEGVRVAIFRRAKKKGASDFSAAMDSRDATLDFSRAGKHGRVANRYIPFLNAGIQGADKLVRAFKEKPAAMTMRGVATITLPSIILTGYFLYGAPDDEREEYLEIPQWQKDIFWIVPTPWGLKRYPKPFSLGYFFGTSVERMMLWGYQGEKPEAESMWRDTVLGLAGSFSPVQDVGTLMTPAGRMAVESLTNYNFFMGRNIYSPYMDRLLPEDRSNKYSSETAKELGKVFNVSPAIIDNQIRGVLASSSAYALKASDGLIKQVKKWNGEKIPERPVTDADKLFVKSFSVRRANGYQAISTQNFMNRYRELKQIHASYNKRKGDERAQFRKDYSTELRAYKPMKAFNDRIGTISEQVDKIYDDPRMTSEKKVERIDRLNDQILDLAQAANSWFKENVKEEIE